LKKYIIYVTIFAFALTAYAADRLKIRKFGGLQTRSNPYEIKNEESPDMSNFVLDEAGTLTERDLFKHYNATSAGSIPLTNVYKFYKTSDAGYFICAGGTTLYNATAGDLNDVGVTTTTVTSNSEWDFETFTDGVDELVYAANQDVRLSSWNGTSDNFIERESDQAPAENCSILKTHKSRLFASGSDEYPYRLYYSSLTAGSNWVTSGGTLDLPAYEKIMALEVLSDVLYLFTRNAIYALLGDTPNEFYINKTRSTIGTHARKSVVVGNKLIIFLNKAGVFAFDGDQSTNISETIQPTIDLISSTYIGDSAGLYDKSGKYWLTYTSQNASFNDTILVYDTVIKQWYMLNGANFSSFFKAEGGTDKGELYAGCSDSLGFLWQLQSTSAVESVIHYLKTQLESGVTFNTAIMGTETAPFAEIQIVPDEVHRDTSLLLHFEGADAATSTEDSTTTGNTITFVGNAQLDIDRKVGETSLLLDGSGDNLRLANSNDWDLFSQPSATYTISYWIKPDALTAARQYVIMHREDGQNHWSISHDNAATGIDFTLESGGATQVSFTGGTLTDDVWQHIVFFREGAIYGLYLDGDQVAYDSDADTGSNDGSLYIGTLAEVGNYLEGRLDEMRIFAGNPYNCNPTVAEDDVIDFVEYKSNSTITSDNLQINASSQSTLGAIEWNETLASDTDIQFTTRTGTTDCTVFTDYLTWEGWVSGSSVSVNTVSDGTVWDTSNANLLQPLDSGTQTLDILYHEDEYSLDFDSSRFTVTALATNITGCTVLPAAHPVDLSDYKFIGFWLKSPVTGNSIKLGLGEVSPNTVIYVTSNTVDINVWEKHYWSLDNYTDADIDNIVYLELEYLGDAAGDIYLGEVWAYDFFDSEDTITSTPDDWIQYRGILGTADSKVSPDLIQSNNVVISLSYFSGSGTEETSLSSYYYTKPFDMESEYNKFFNWVELTLETSNSTTDATVYIDWDTDDGERTGTLSKEFAVTGSRTKLRYYFPSGTWGKDIQLKIYDDDLDNDVKIHNMNLSYTLEGGN